MNPERWQQIEQLYNSALKVEADRRESFLKEACGGDESLRKEVEQLLASQPHIERFIESPALDVAAKALAKEQANVLANDLIGRTISHYRVTEKIGQGGMGEVFLAEDTSLHRKVALKFLPPEMQQDPVAHKRFLREARSAAALDNPYICSIHEVGEFEGKDFIVMEYVDGQTLMDKLRRGRLPLNQALQIATEVAEALQAAHGKGIIHRDLKPSNIMLLKTGHAKVMDFGLAKQIVPSGRIESQEESVSAMTRTGMTLGTLAYMSPEQLRGEQVDVRSDIFSFGLVLYEMLTGTHPFRKESPMETGSAILHQEAKAVGAVTQGIPPDLEKLIGRCLRKDLARRFQNIGDVKIELEEAKEQPGSRTVPEGSAVVKHTRRRWLWATCICIVLLAAGTWVWRIRTGSEPLPPRVVPFTNFPGQEMQPAFSPDGHQLAFVWTGENDDNPDIYVKLIGEGHTPLRLTSDPAADEYPAWSPDGQRIAFVRSSQGVCTVFVISALGGKERKLAQVGFAGERLSWSPDGKFLAMPVQNGSGEPMPIFLISTESGETRQLTSPPRGSNGDFSPVFSPDGRSVAFVRLPIFFSAEADLYLQNILPAGVPAGTARRATFDRKVIKGLDWSQDGKSLIFSSDRDGTQRLWRIAVPGSSEQGSKIAPPEPLTVGSDRASWPAVARVGNRMAWVTVQAADVDLWRVACLNPALKAEPAARFAASTRNECSPQFSPDGKKVAFMSDRSGDNEIWICSSQGEGPFPVTSFEGSALVGTPRWSPDGSEIAFDAAREGSRDIYVVSAEGGEARRITTEPSQDVRPSWAWNGKWIYFGSNRSGDWQIWKVSPSGGVAVQVTRHGGREAFESRDGKFVYYTKQPSVAGIWKMPADGGEETRVLDRGLQSYWAVGKEGFFYIDFDFDPRRIQFFSFQNGRLSLVTELPKGFRSTADGSLAVSPDGRWIIYAGYSRLEGDILLVENFR